MVESRIEKIINKLQLIWFIIDSLKDGGDINEGIVDKAYNSLDEIKALLYGCEKERQDILDFIKELRAELKGDANVYAIQEKIKIIDKLEAIYENRNRNTNCIGRNT